MSIMRWSDIRRRARWGDRSRGGRACELSGIEVLDRYVTALGGLLEVVANFGDEQFKAG